MRLRLRIPHDAPRRWHADLAGRLAALPGMRLEIAFGHASASLPPNAELLLRLEALVRGKVEAGPSTRIPASSFARFAGGEGEPDLVIDLCGDLAPAARVWHLNFDGVAGEAALFAALIAQRAPIVRVRGEGACLIAGRPTSDSGEILRYAFEDALARSATLIATAVEDRRAGISRPLPAGLEERETRPDTGRETLGALRLAGLSTGLAAAAVARRLQRLCLRVPHWRVGWRRVTGGDVFDLQSHPHGGWRTLPDDATRFYADPFPILHEGTVTLFVEDFVHALGRGIVSAVAFGPNGPLGKPEPVLEEPHHLSYPFVFAREGAVWMIPESGAAGTVDLYRATAFPGGWRKEATLLSGMVVGDATLMEEGGRWWMFGTVQDGGSASDALHLWSAPDFRGPWTAHPRNPVLVDAQAARPAGRIVRRGGRLIRPVQDCSARYGGGLALARIMRLDEEGFAQSIETRMTAGPRWRGRHLHTLNRAGPFEFIDGTGYAPRLVLGQGRSPWRRTEREAPDVGGSAPRARDPSGGHRPLRVL